MGREPTRERDCHVLYPASIKREKGDNNGKKNQSAFG